MTEVEFCYFLQGFFEINNPKKLNKNQVKMIKEYLNKIDITKEKPAHNVVTYDTKIVDDLIRC